MNTKDLLSEIIVVCILLGFTIYSLYYLFVHKHFKELTIKLKDLFKDLYKYTLNFLTPIFIFVFYSELLIKKVLSSNFSVRQTMERNPQNWIEFGIFLFYIIVFFFLFFRWAYKVLIMCTKKILEIEYTSSIVTFTIRIYAFLIFLPFYLAILLPMFIYGMLGNFGNPNI